MRANPGREENSLKLLLTLSIFATLAVAALSASRPLTPSHATPRRGAAAAATGHRTVLLSRPPTARVSPTKPAVAEHPQGCPPATIQDPGVCPLAPVEEAIVREPFAPKAVRGRLAKAAARAKPKPPSSKREGMGWTQPDREYWRRIPAAAKEIPRDWSALPVVRFTNTEVGGPREVRLRRGPAYDQWLLRDFYRRITACISVNRATRRVYFMEVGRQPDGRWDLRVSADKCYSCHPSGPRVIRPLNEPKVARRQLAEFNRRILAYGACDFGDSLSDELRWHPIDDEPCAGCHNGARRGRLYGIHRRAITFKMDREATMPVSFLPRLVAKPLPGEDRQEEIPSRRRTIP
jgi:hypothetical protein